MFLFRSSPERQDSFDRFLFASIGQEDHSMPVSVLSLFSRLDLDPAMEARVLLMLPKPSAAERLARHILSLPGNVLGDSDAREQANSLVLLLPGPSVAAPTQRPPVTFATLVTAWLCSLVAIMAMTLVTQWAGNAWHHNPTTPIIVTDELATNRAEAGTQDLHSPTLMRRR